MLEEARETAAPVTDVHSPCQEPLFTLDKRKLELGLCLLFFSPVVILLPRFSFMFSGFLKCPLDLASFLGMGRVDKCRQICRKQQQSRINCSVGSIQVVDIIEKREAVLDGLFVKFDHSATVALVILYLTNGQHDGRINNCWFTERTPLGELGNSGVITTTGITGA